MEATTAPSAGDGLMVMAPPETNRLTPALQPPLVISNGGVKEECYDACTDDEQVARDASRRVAMKKEEEVDTDDESRTQTPRGVDRAFLKRVEELKAYKVKHGHLNVKRSEDKSLGHFCVHIRCARRNPGRRGAMKLTEDRIAALDGLGFDWAPRGQRYERSCDTFAKRLEELNAYKEKHGHVSVKESEDKGLADFCCSMRYARKYPGRGKTRLTEERIASFDELGFDWAPDRNKAVRERSANLFQKWLEEMKAYKAKHGHLKVKESEDKRLAQFCFDIRRARRGKGKTKLNEERIASLVALGFDWAPKRGGNQKARAFQERVEELKAYKARHGHLKVKWKEDKSLSQFCSDIRQARKGRGRRKLTEEETTSLDELGFGWTESIPRKSFKERVGELKEYKAKNGHLNVKESEDKSLAKFCHKVRQARKGRSNMKLTQERTASLDELGFNWTENHPRKSFQERLNELKEYKAKYGHLKVQWSQDKSLAQFCAHIRNAGRGIGNTKLTEERIASLDALEFVWEPQKAKVKMFQERLEELKTYKAKHGHLNVTRREDKSLASWCVDIRSARRYPEKRLMKLTAERIASLDAIGFHWEPQKIVSATTKSPVDEWIAEEKGER